MGPNNLYLGGGLRPAGLACGIRTQIRPVPPAVESQNLNHWTAREGPKYTVF